MKNRPPKPAIAEPRTHATYLYLITLIPAASAAPGFSPTALKLSPVLDLLINPATIIARTKAK